MAKAPRSHRGHSSVHPGKRGKAQDQGVGSLVRILDALERLHGPPRPPPPRDAFEWILWENVAYLVDDAQRASVFDFLKREVGARPEAILSAPREILLAIAEKGGMHPLERVERLREVATLGSRLRLTSSPADARKALEKFPGIGRPGAEKILLFTGVEPVLALESNGLRVLTRLGFGEEKKSYAATYRSAQDRASAELPSETAALVRAHLLLKQHGQAICRRSSPRCEVCPLAPTCRHYARQRPT